MARSNWRIGMVGLGALGLPMAVNLHQAGHTLQVHTRSRRAENDPQLSEARPASTPPLLPTTSTSCCCASAMTAL